MATRAATPADAETISALVAALSGFFLADPDAPEEAAPFFASIAPEALREAIASARFRYRVAEIDGELAGVVAVRDGSHLYHLFVAERFHRQGLATRLWAEAKEAARDAGNPGRFTVNSSLHAVPVYERFGFVATGPRVYQDGIVYLPMELDEAARESGDVRRRGI